MQIQLHKRMSQTRETRDSGSKMRKGIQEFFTNKNILITGGTGLVGVSLVEKLLRAFPKIGTINLVVRPKNGATLSQRASTYFEQDAFSRLKLTNSDFRKKIVWLEGDITKPRLGLSSESLRHINETVNVIYHSAATVKFVEPLSNAIKLNLCGTNEVLKIAKSCRKLNCLMHVSTSFVNHRLSRSRIDDECYEFPQDPKDLIDMHDTLTKEEVEARAKDLLDDWPNTYIYTKNAAENLLWRNGGDLKIGIFRPGTITEAYKEPYPYWMINFSGFSAVLRIAHTGITLNFDPKAPGNSTPVDLCTNALIAATWELNNLEEKTRIYTYGMNEPNWRRQYHFYLKNLDDPWLMFGSFKYRALSHLKDLVLEMCGKKGIYLDEIRRQEKTLQIMKYFSAKEFTINTRNIDALWEAMDAEEKKLFLFNLAEVDWKDYFGNMYLANKKHLVDVMDYKPTMKAIAQS